MTRSQRGTFLTGKPAEESDEFFQIETPIGIESPTVRRSRCQGRNFCLDNGFLEFRKEEVFLFGAAIVVK